MGEAASGRNRIERLGDQLGAAIAEPFCQMRVEAGRIIIEQARQIGAWQRVGRLGLAKQREPRRRALRIGRVGLERLAEGVGRPLGVAELLPRFREREPGGGPVRRLLERLLEHFRGDGEIAVIGGGLAVGVAAPGDEVDAGERVRQCGLTASLADREIPAPLISQFLPRLAGVDAQASPRTLVLAAIDRVLAEYAAACRTS